MSKVRICYSEGEEVRFISHLDFLRCITRTMRRAEIPVKYSEGFNPHVVMTIGLPLSVGTTTVCDCLDVALARDMDCGEIMNRMNASAPRAIHINGVKKADALTPLYKIDSALYEARFQTDKPVEPEKYIEAPSVIIEKKSKRKVNEVNIKDFIRHIDAISSNGTEHMLLMHINAGNVSNLKPELVIKSMERFFGCSATDVHIERKEIYFEDMTKVF